MDGLRPPLSLGVRRQEVLDLRKPTTDYQNGHPSPSRGRPSRRAARSRAQHPSPLAAEERAIYRRRRLKPNPPTRSRTTKMMMMRVVVVIFDSSFGGSRTSLEHRATQLVGLRSRPPRIAWPHETIRPEVAAAEHGVAADSPPWRSLGPLAVLARLAAERRSVRRRLPRFGVRPMRTQLTKISLTSRRRNHQPMRS